MSLLHLLGLSPTVPRRCPSPATAVPPPPWAIIERKTAVAKGTGPGASLWLRCPPNLSRLDFPKHLVRTSTDPDHGSDAVQPISGSLRSASSDGLLLLSYIVPGQGAHFKHFVCNTVTGELSRLPDPRPSDPVHEVMCGLRMGLLTRAGPGDGHDGPPDRFAVAELHGDQMVRFLSETEEWETVPVSPCQLPDARRMVLDHEVVAFGGRLWWLDVTCGAISADPFSDRPELCFVELPKDSVLPAAAQDGSDRVTPSKHRRLCVSEGRLRYIEVSPDEPFVLTTFALDEEASGWTLQHRLDLSGFEADHFGHPWLPLKEGNTPHIGFLDPLNHNLVYMSATITTLEGTPRVVFLVHMERGEVIQSYAYESDNPYFLPCVLPPWLGSSQIPAAGKKDAKKKQGHGLVRADVP
ncbi:uncharacterized protein [Lolium perenne]|uniref:uncharacterized protein n=1 Tax=Lolium perenne TaxID=4522 RepID=UPI0021F5DA4C|nr:uncharacterized protein LOC127320062 [Lolium perenne]XP_051205759.1 uncharacterized protein LOC127320062 [Lolium perenne]XP_051205760.1 uncharacterized protein LOC127320062 [Lolium perenne]XP_051205761.1 uncharacterized protein LOC127320062 [Lolium perenne]